MTSPNGEKIRERTKKHWKERGSILLLVLVAAAFFVAGSGFQGYLSHNIFVEQQAAFDRKEQDYRKRNRELNDRWLLLAPEVRQSAMAAQEAAAHAKDAADKADNAATVLKQTTEAKENGENLRP
ncbi:hypothetical protein POR1_25 [Pseudomonas phage POR1]|uniref:Uncharacterized protein n=1 Tax=Pseudomonas phage POR1 TaxID=1718594 RepID=A0A0N9RR12_9CAUD|nr:hypothetical protein POR1_25 [Pseudomonas phage POR1]